MATPNYKSLITKDELVERIEVTCDTNDKYVVGMNLADAGFRILDVSYARLGAGPNGRGVDLSRTVYTCERVVQSKGAKH